MLQAQHRAGSNTAVALQKQLVEGSSTHDPFGLFCKQGTAELNFNGFQHGDRIGANSVKGVTITAKVRAQGCRGPLLVLDTTKPTPDGDLKPCMCKLLVYSQDGDRNAVNDCDALPGPVVTFTFRKLQNILSVDLFDQEAQSQVKVGGSKKGDVCVALVMPVPSSG